MDTDPAGGLRDQLVGRLVDAGAIRTPAVEQAFRAVPRHVFLPGVDVAAVYQDEAIVTRRDDLGRPTSSSSQPAIMAVMLEQLDVHPGHRVLEIGAGTGYNAALLARLTGPTGRVVTMDIDAEVVCDARRHLAEAGCHQVRVVVGDGGLGWPEDAPYDRVILTVGAWDLAPAWWDQLADDGRLVLPLSLRGMQRSLAFDREGDHLVSGSVVDCGFMPMRGCLARPNPERPLDGRPGVFLEVDGGQPLDTGALSAALGQPGTVLPTGLSVSGGEVAGGLGLWLMLRDPRAGQLSALGDAAHGNLVPDVVGFPQMAVTLVLAEGNSMAALTALGAQPGACTGSFELGVMPFGPGGDALASGLASAVAEWDEHGRRSSDQLCILAYPREAPPPGPDAVVVDKTHSRLILNWD